MFERRIVILANNQDYDAVLCCDRHDDRATIKIVCDALKISSEHESGSFFHCLMDLREHYEPDGILLRCAGAQVDVWPSPMSLQAGGEKVYRTVMGEPATSELISIFDAGEVELLGTVDSHKAYHDDWIASL